MISLFFVKGIKMRQIITKMYITWYYNLPTIQKVVGILDRYRGGVVRHIDFIGECTVVWVGYATITKAYSYR